MNKILSLLAALAVIGGVIFWSTLQAEDAVSEDIEIISGDETYTISDLRWVKVGQSWRVEGNLFPIDSGMDRMAFLDILTDICTTLVTEKPGAPEDGILQQRIYRTDLVPLAEAPIEGASVDAIPAPVPVINGACGTPDRQMAAGINLPQPAADWLFTDMNLNTTDGSQILSLVLQSSEDLSMEEIRQIPFIEVCQILVTDPVIQRTVNAAFGFSLEEAQDMRIEIDATAKDPGLLSLSRGAKTGFDYSDGTCARGQG